jgi:hypothetical protein
MFIAKNNNLIILAKDTREELEQALQLMQYTDIEETDIDYQLYNGQYLTPEEIAEQERIRIANLHLTRGDVFRGLLLAKGVTRVQLRAIIEQMPEETPEQKIAKEYALIDFDEALDFYRGVALIDRVGKQLGITPKQMTKFFETGDWHELVNEEENNA